MSITRVILVILVCASPAFVFWDGLVAQGVLAGTLAVALAITAGGLRPVEAGFLVSIARPPLLVGAIPALWIAFQVLPLKLLAHPMWQSAGAALGRSITGTISIDPGATVIALGLYLCLVSVAFLSVAVAADRERAASILYALTAAVTIVAIIRSVHDSFLPDTWKGLFDSSQLIDCVAMGPLIAGAACIRTIERSKPLQARAKPFPALDGPFLACGAAFAICASSLLIAPSRSVLFASGYGLLGLFGAMIIRRFELRLLGVIGIIIPALGLALLLIAAHPVERNVNVSLAFAANSSAALVAMSQRMLTDLPIAGTGAGTFASLAPIYREMGDPPPGRWAATAAATLTIELGKPMFWYIVAAATAAMIVLLRAALKRGRDFFYSALGGACLITQLILAFSNAGLMHSVTGIILAAVLGIALAQSKSRVITR